VGKACTRVVLTVRLRANETIKRIIYLVAGSIERAWDGPPPGGSLEKGKRKCHESLEFFARVGKSYRGPDRGGARARAPLSLQGAR